MSEMSNRKLTMKEQAEKELTERLLPFWENLKDEKNGGYYGYVGEDLAIDKTAVKGCILNSRILWFFSNAYLVLGDHALLPFAEHAYLFLRDFMYDREEGGVFWSLTYDGKPFDAQKHTYNMAFAIYALSSYFDASKDKEALRLANELFHTIEKKCFGENGYEEAFSRSFALLPNEKLSENGVMARYTMNTLLHLLEAYTELFRVSAEQSVKARILGLLGTFRKYIYAPSKQRQEVFFDSEWRSLIDLHSYGHDIETSWLMDRTIDILQEPYYEQTLFPITAALAENVYQLAYKNDSLANECCEQVVDQTRIWWVQAEAVVGFLNAYQKSGDHKYKEAAERIYAFIHAHFADQRAGSEWFWAVDASGAVKAGLPIADPWKCPYHNGRMYFEILKRGL